MPEISRFLGIVVAMYYRDHAPPHFHARYRDWEVRIDIGTGEILSGRLPSRAQRLVLEWCELRRDELLDNWERARASRPLEPIDPLE